MLEGGGLSTLSTWHTGNVTSFAPPYARLQPLFIQQHNLAPAQVDTIALTVTVADLENRVMVLQDAFDKFKKLNNDTLIKVLFVILTIIYYTGCRETGTNS